MVAYAKLSNTTIKSIVTISRKVRKFVGPLLRAATLRMAKCSGETLVVG
jgi:hypothetical protein